MTTITLRNDPNPSLIGALVPYKVVTRPWTVALLLTIVGGTWVNLEAIGARSRLWPMCSAAG